MSGGGEGPARQLGWGALHVGESAGCGWVLTWQASPHVCSCHGGGTPGRDWNHVSSSILCTILLMSYWAKQVSWPSPDSRGRETGGLFSGRMLGQGLLQIPPSSWSQLDETNSTDGENFHDNNPNKTDELQPAKSNLCPHE